MREAAAVSPENLMAAPRSGRHIRRSNSVRQDLENLVSMQAGRLDDARPAAVARQRKRGKWTVREALAALADADSFT